MQKSHATGFIGRRLVRRLATDFGISSTVCPEGLFGTIMTSALVRRIDWPARTSIIHVDDVAAVMSELATHPQSAGVT